MSTYAIGDVQGCFDELQNLLKLFHFNPDSDQLWFVGDLVNRGPQSLAVLRFIKNLANVKIVLGNHDLHLIALAYGHTYRHHQLKEVLTAPDLDEIIQWLCRIPFLHYDEKLNYVMTHAGIYPLWDLTQAKAYAKELSLVLQSKRLPELLKHLYGDQPDQWNENLSGWDRLRFITNAFTRMRFCTPDGKLDLHHKGGLNSLPDNCLPWFKLPTRVKDCDIIFGHWAALNGKTDEAHIFALDTGCIWGNSLTAMRLEDRQFFRVPCQSHGK